HPYLKGIALDQVQDFTPTPMTASSVMYYARMSIKDRKKIFVEKNPEEKRRQKSLFFKNR
ncbi:MAG: DUF3362 domain-containing protein, partial [Candidatus Coprenecus sp.]|nr:DUF3362 domain-containing protein [Candidatus Coprenecus sp.]